MEIKIFVIKSDSSINYPTHSKFEQSEDNELNVLKITTRTHPSEVKKTCVTILDRSETNHFRCPLSYLLFGRGRHVGPEAFHSSFDDD